MNNINCIYCKLSLDINNCSKNNKNQFYKSCNDCRIKKKEQRERNKCEHNKQKAQCIECGGGSICEHQKIKSTCKVCDYIGHLSHIVRVTVRHSLKNNKELSSKEYLGCNIEELKIHIENQFLEGMTWDNYGEWHIDHIIPLKYQNPTLEETIERLHFSNTQPLWATDNLSKGNRFIG